jgi:hypothetical protein
MESTEVVAKMEQNSYMKFTKPSKAPESGGNSILQYSPYARKVSGSLT